MQQPRSIPAWLALLLSCTSAVAAVEPIPLRPVHTFSIVARDPVTGDLGVAVQSHWFSVGAVVTWAEPGVGGDQALERLLGPLAGAHERQPQRPVRLLDERLRGHGADAGRDVRQV